MNILHRAITHTSTVLFGLVLMSCHGCGGFQQIHQSASAPIEGSGQTDARESVAGSGSVWQPKDVFSDADVILHWDGRQWQAVIGPKTVALSELEGKERIRSIEIRISGDGDEVLPFLEGEFPNLRAMAFRGEQVDAVIPELWEFLRYPGNRRLTELRFETVRVPPAAFVAMTAMPDLAALAVRGSSVDQESLKLLGLLKLKYLWLQFGFVDSRTETAFTGGVFQNSTYASLPVLPSIEYFRLTDCAILGDDASDIARVFPRVATMIFDDSSVSPKLFGVLARSHVPLANLDVSQMSNVDAAISEIRKLSSLRRIRINRSLSEENIAQLQSKYRVEYWTDEARK